jgi:thiol-disulfide isomerase/thioredoxin
MAGMRILSPLTISSALWFAACASGPEFQRIRPHDELAGRPYSQGREPAQSAFSIDASEPLVGFYSKKYPSLKDWQAMELPEPLRLPGGKPVARFYNTHLLQARSAGGKTLWFRPVDTTTGCNSGCTPVVFHLALDAAGRVFSILEEDAFPLRKVYHQVFTANDKSLVLKSARELPKGLEYVGEPKQLTDELSVFPPQTWNAFRPFLVSGGAYTSYRIYEAAIGAYRALNPSLPEVRQLQKDLDAVEAELEAIESYAAADAFVLAAPARISDVAAHPRLRAKIAGASLRLAGQLLGRGYDLAKYDALFATQVVKDAFRRPYCELLSWAAEGASGARFVVRALETPDSFPACDADFSKVLGLVAYKQLGDTAGYEKYRASVNFTKLPRFLVRNARWLGFYAAEAAAAGFGAESVRYWAELKIRFPSFVPALAYPTGDAAWAAALARAEDEYRQELRRGFLDPPRKTPAVQAHQGLNYEKKSAVTLPQPAPEAKLLLFFASWCPHCKNTISSLAKAGWGAEFWDRVQLVEIFPKPDRATLEDFCESTGMNATPWAAKCTQALRLDRDAEHSAFLDRLEIYGIPKMVIVNAHGEIVTTSFEPPEAEFTDFQRDVRWALEAAR